MPLRFIDIQHFFGLKIKTAVEQGQALRNIFVNCTFADPKLLCSGADGGPILYDVKSQTLGPVLHISLQTIHSPPSGGSVYAAGKDGMTYKAFRKRLKENSFWKIAEIVFGAGEESWYDTSVIEF